jgi:transposase
VKAIPVSVRERILHFYNEGRKTKDIASLFGYCPAAIRRVRQRFKQRGTLEPQTHRCGRKSLLTDARKKRLLAALDKRPDATLAELGAQFKRPASTIDLWLARLGWSCKKKRFAPPSGPGSTSRGPGNSGIHAWRRFPPAAWCFWMRAAPTPR